jgi:hypothetical protein
VISTATNFSGRRCLDWESVSSFARECHFPEHGLILRSEKSGTDFLKKGLQDWGSLQEFTRTCLEQFGCCYVETDMRAQYNPMRMQVIQEATQKLVTIIGTPCPACAAPGFEVVALEPGLPCSACGRPTKSTRSIRYACQSCLYQEKRKHPQGKNLEDPMYCDHCNP